MPLMRLGSACSERLHQAAALCNRSKGWTCGKKKRSEEERDIGEGARSQEPPTGAGNQVDDDKVEGVEEELERDEEKGERSFEQGGEKLQQGEESQQR